MSELLKRIQTGQRHIGYGSVHDGEKAKVRVCGDCVDQLFKRLEVKEETN